MLLAPASEVWGRRPVYLVSWFLFCLCQIPVSQICSLLSSSRKIELKTSVDSRSPSHTTFRWSPPLGSFPDSSDRKSIHPTQTLHVSILTPLSLSQRPLKQCGRYHHRPHPNRKVRLCHRPLCARLGNRPRPRVRHGRISSGEARMEVAVLDLRDRLWSPHHHHLGIYARDEGEHR
jgi:hypothetical protein